MPPAVSEGPLRGKGTCHHLRHTKPRASLLAPTAGRGRAFVAVGRLVDGWVEEKWLARDGRIVGRVQRADGAAA